VFALIDSLTVQSSFSGVRLESYMFTRESFEAVRDHLSPRGVMALYNYFREPWLVSRLANTVAQVFGREPLGHVHQDRAYLGVMLAGQRLRPVVVAFLLPRRRLHAARNQVDRPIRAAVGIDLVVGVARDRVGAGDGAGEHDDREPDCDRAAPAGGGGADRADRRQLF